MTWTRSKFRTESRRSVSFDTSTKHDTPVSWGASEMGGGDDVENDRTGCKAPRRIAVSQRLRVDVMSRHLVCSALGVATLTLAVCSSTCVQTQNEHRPAAQALADLRASAEAGDPEAQFILGGLYLTGGGVPPDAAEQGHARAQYNLGAMYAEGRGVPPRDTGRKGLIIALELLFAL